MMDFGDMINAYLEGMPDGWPGKEAKPGTDALREVVVDEFTRLGRRLQRLLDEVPVHDADADRTYKQIALHALMDAFVLANRAAVEQVNVPVAEDWAAAGLASLADAGFTTTGDLEVIKNNA